MSLARSLTNKQAGKTHAVVRDTRLFSQHVIKLVPPPDLSTPARYENSQQMLGKINADEHNKQQIKDKTNNKQ